MMWPLIKKYLFDKSVICTVALFMGIAAFSTVEIAGKVVASHAAVAPLPMVFMRFFVTGIILTAFGLPGYLKKKRLAAKDFGIFFLNGLLGIFGSLYLFHLGIGMFENASSSAVVFSANALFTCVLAKFINNESLTFKKVFAVLIGLVGITCFVYEKGEPNMNTLLAILTMCSAALLFAVSVCITKCVVKNYGAMLFMGMTSIFGALITLPFAFVVNGGIQLDAITKAFPSMCYMVLVGTTIAYLLYYYGLSGVSAFKASMAFFIKPVLACIFAWIYLGNKMNAWTISGTVIIIISMCLTLNFKRSRKAMKVVNLTSETVGDEGYRPVKFEERRVPISSADGKTHYTGMVWNVSEDTMAGSYIDLPGHILETDDGVRGNTVDAAFFYRHPASVLHFDSKDGAVHASDLEHAAGDRKLNDFLIINALGKRNTMQVPSRTIYLDLDAVDWIISHGCKCLVSDIYESKRLDGVFSRLFAAGISTVCMPVNLCKIPDEVLLTIAFPKWPTTQIPCVLLAECQE